MSNTAANTTDIDKLLSNVKNAYVPIKALYGVDESTATITPHPDVFQPKTTIRREVIDSVKLAATCDAVPPIEIRLMEDGSLAVIDGYHRVTAFLEYNLENPKDDRFRRIRVIRNYSSLEDAEFAAVRENLDNGRSNLTPAEELTAFERFLQKGWTPDEINEKLGGGQKRYVKALDEIVNANPAIAEAVKQGHVSIETASKVARKTPVGQQAAVIAQAARIEKTKGGVAARQETGLRSSKPSIMRLNEIYNWTATWFPMYHEQVRTEGMDVDENLEGKFEAITAILKIDNMTPTKQLAYVNGIVTEIEERLAKKNAPKPVKEPKVKAPKAAKVKTAPKAKAAKPVPTAAKNPGKKPGEIIVVGEKKPSKPMPVKPKVPVG